jgi:hypothetical protein
MSILKLILFSEWDILPQLFILNTLQQNTPARKQNKKLSSKKMPLLLHGTTTYSSLSKFLVHPSSPAFETPHQSPSHNMIHMSTKAITPIAKKPAPSLNADFFLCIFR